MAATIRTKSNRSDRRVKCVLEIQRIGDSSHCSEPSNRDGRVRLEQLVGATEKG